MTFSRMFAFMLFVLVPTGCACARDGDERALKSALDTVIDRALADKRIVGTVVLVARDGAIVYRRAAGYADRESRRPMRERTQFRLASMSKPIVSATALALIDQGKLALDDPVTKWLPDFRPKLADGSSATITIRQLLTHTAGLGYRFLEAADGPYHRADVSDGLDQPGLAIEENLRRIASVPLLYAPGSRWGYSLAIDVLGAVLAHVGEAPLPSLVRHEVTAPLHMRDTGFVARDAARVAVAYADGKPEPIRMRDGERVAFGPGDGISYAPSRAFDAASYASGGAGMIGSADDFLVFLEALRTGKPAILKPATLAAMKSSQIGDLDVDASGPGWGFGYGFAVLIDPRAANTPQSVGTFTWGGAYGHSWFVDPERRLTVVALTDTAVEGMSGQFPTAIRDAVYAASKAPAPERR